MQEAGPRGLDGSWTLRLNASDDCDFAVRFGDRGTLEETQSFLVVGVAARDQNQNLKEAA